MEFQSGTRVTLGEIAEATGINRMTLSKMINHRGHNTQSDNLDRLCRYFDCRIQDLVEYVPDEMVANAQPRQGAKGNAQRTTGRNPGGSGKSAGRD